MRQFLIFLVLIICSAFSLSAKSYPIPFKTEGNIYGFKTSEKDKETWPKFRYAGKFTNGLAPVSFDNYNYALTNEYECIATEFCFKGIPEYVGEGLVAVKDPKGNGYLANQFGEPLTPNIKNMNFSHGILTGTDTISGKAVLYGTDLSIIPGSERKRYVVTNDYVSIGDTTYAIHFLVGTDDNCKSNRYVISSATDAAGKSLFPEGLCCFEPMTNFNHLKSIRKLVSDKDFPRSILSFFYTGRRNDKVGLYFIDGSEIIPPTFKDEEKVMNQFAKIYKKSIAPRFKSGELYSAAINTIERLNRAEKESTAAYTASFRKTHSVDAINPYATLYSPSVSVKSETVKTNSKAAKGKKAKKGKKTPAKTVFRFDTGFGTSTKPGETVFDELNGDGPYFIGRKQGEKKYHLYNEYGIQMTVDPYDEIQPWGYNKDNEERFRVRDGKLWGVIDKLGRELFTPQFSEIPMGISEKNAIVAVRDDKYYLVDFNRAQMVNGVAYDFIESFDINGKHEASRLGYKTKVDQFGKEHPSIGTVAYDEACETEMSPEEKVVAFAKCIELCGPDDRKILGMAYNNMGYYYQEAGDLENAKKFYREGVKYGNDLASNNLRNLTSAGSSNSGGDGGGNFLSILGQIANALGQMGGNTAMGGFFNGMAGNGTTVGDDTGSFSSGGTDYGSSSSGGSSLDPSYYTNTYQRWENQAKSNYESLTLRGTRTSRNGQAESGTTEGFWRHHTSGLKRLLRNAQSEMRKIRQEARRAGINIPQSNYETVTVQ